MLLTGLTPLFKAAAQVTGMTIDADYGGFYGAICTIPNESTYTVYGELTGTFTDADSMTVYMNFGDGSDTTYNIYDTAYYYTQASHTYTMPGHFIQSVTITAGAVSQTKLCILGVALSDSCSMFTGKMYMDLNGNCVQDAGEPGVSSMPVYVVDPLIGDTTIRAFTDDTGLYAMSLVSGSYTILAGYALALHAYGPYGNNIAPSCPATGAYVATVDASSTYAQNFAFVCAPHDSFDMQIHGYNAELVRGHNGWLGIWAGNFWDGYGGYTCDPLASTVTLTLDPHLSYVGVRDGDPIPSSVSGSTITWNLATTTDYFNFEAYVEVYCDASVALETSLCNMVTATATSLPDPNLANNTATFCDPVLGSFDPNGINVSPQGTDTPGYIPNNTQLTYAIHFQNTGSDTAYSVTLDDTLDSHLEINTLHVLHSSSPVYTYMEGNVVKFRFDNINLVDSMADPVRSIGTIEYGIMPKPNLAPGTPIKAKAGIYFDFNSPVVTNTALNTIELPASVPQVVSKGFDISVYPNPANEEVTIQSADRSSFNVSITDMAGREMTAKATPTGIVIINTHSIPAGIYLVKTTNSNDKVLIKKITIQH